MTETDAAGIRESLQRAAADLLEGRAPGPLTSIRVAELAGVKRHRLTHDNPDINAAFQERARDLNRAKPEIENLRSQLELERKRAARLNVERDALAAQLRNYATALIALTDERDELLRQLQYPSKIAPLRK